jgi:thiosulfate/3-mercaptopyruvate sulfurtransferase
MIARLTVAALVAAALPTGCAPDATSAASAEAPRVSTLWLSVHLEDPDVVLLDVRPDPQLFDAGHVPGAVHLALPRLDPAPGEVASLPPALLLEVLRRQGIRPESHVVVYARGGGDADEVARLLLAAGQPRVSVLDGGLERWTDEGRPMMRRTGRSRA